VSRFAIDEQGWQLLTQSESGPTGRMMYNTLRGMEQEITERQQRRMSGKVPYRTTSGLTRTAEGLKGSVEMRRTAPHIIRPRRAGGRLVFVPRGQSGRVYARIVHHPGSTPPSHYLLEALNKATVKAP
jgi:hypothetical protein